MKILIKALNWLDHNLLLLLSLFLLAFIPLFPKIPLFDALPGYIVRVRVEDFLILLTGLVWLRQVLTKRIEWNTSWFWLVGAYGVIGLISILLGMFLLQTVPLGQLHIGKSFLHLFRYLEYFSIFFFAYSAIRSKKHLYLVVSVMVLTLVGVVGYGIGQKYLNFPLYSTMNREYSKGVKLYLQPGARLQSTFAGNYDLAAYLVVVLPLIFALSLAKVEKKSKALQLLWSGSLQVAHLLGLWILFISGSKSALFAYGLGILTVMLFYLARLKSWRLRLYWGAAAAILLLVGSGVFWTVAPNSTKANLTSLVQKVFIQNDSVVASDAKPVDLYGDGYEFKLEATPSAQGGTVYIMKRTKSDFSANALKYGLSMGIRLDTLWPRALSGLANNPLFGSGYGTLAMLESGRFVEADSTDNNFLRTLGETGFLGFISFYGLVFLLIKEILPKVRSDDSLVAALSIGFLGTTIGLLVDAIYIDVFAASKVAFTFWVLAGVVIKAKDLASSKNSNQLQVIKLIKNHFIKHWSLYLILLIAFFSFHLRPFAEKSLAKNIENNLPALENLVSAKCFIEYGQFNLCRNNGLVLKPFASSYSLVLVPFLKLLKEPTSFYFLNMGLLLLTTIASYSLWHKKKFSQEHIFLGLINLLALNYLLGLGRFPLTQLQLLTVVLLIPLVSFLLIFILTKLNKNFGNLFGIVFVFLLLVVIFQRDFMSEMAVRFRNNAVANAYKTVIAANKHFKNEVEEIELKAADLAQAQEEGELIAQGNVSLSDEDPYLITTLNPYYVDLYSNNQYKLLPLSLEQDYINQATQVWGDYDFSDLNRLYNDLLNSQKELYITDSGIFDNQILIEKFQGIKRSFNLSYEILGCDEQCNFYKVEPDAPIISEEPISVAGDNLAIDQIEKPFKFVVVSSRFDPDIRDGDIPYTTDIFMKNLDSFRSMPLDFAVFTGDLTHVFDRDLADYFTTFFADRLSYPLIFNSGNLDLTPGKIHPSQAQAFFTDDSYFILLKTDENSQLSTTDQIVFYNQLLKLEKLEGIKNLFIISHDLNWQDKSDPLAAIHIVERKLKDFPELNKHIITANHEAISQATLDLDPEEVWLSSVQSEEDNLTYWASLVAGVNNDGYLEFLVDDQGVVSVDFKTLN